jgi:hypothetical protein
MAAIASPAPLDRIKVGAASRPAVADQAAKEAGKDTHEHSGRRMRARELTGDDDLQ